MQKVLGVDVVCNKCLVQKAVGIKMCVVSTQLESANARHCNAAAGALNRILHYTYTVG